MSPFLVNATGAAALALNVAGLVRACDRSLRRSTGWASALWAANNLLMGAEGAAALSALSVGRQASAQAVQGSGVRMRNASCWGFMALTLAIGLATWNGIASLFTTAGSMLSTYAMFTMRGSALRIAMVVVAAFWMVNAWAYDSWWQMLGNAVNGGAAAYGAWRTARAPQAD